MKDFSIICAVSMNGVIGDSETNSIPWYLPLDLKHFKSITSGHTVVMGSKTYRSIGKPLPNRRNVVITRNHEEGVKMVHDEGIDDTYPDFKSAFKYERPGFFVIGGQHIYGEALKMGPTRLFLTIVKLEGQGDVRFPISGQQLLNDMFVTSVGTEYKVDRRSGWLDGNGIKFQFTEWVPRLP